VLEIGYGARPYRLIALLSLGTDAWGVDAEVPILRRSTGVLGRVAHQRLGAGRQVACTLDALRSTERVAFRAEVERRARTLRIDAGRFLVSDAAALDLETGLAELVVSEDVFEHIAAPSLEALLPKMARWLKSDGVALIRLNKGIGARELARFAEEEVSDGLRTRDRPDHKHPLIASEIRPQPLCSGKARAVGDIPTSDRWRSIAGQFR
jgi:SAM-dependent methyltransferase